MKRMKEIRTGLLLLLGVGSSACAADGTIKLPAAAPMPYPPAGYTHTVSSSHVTLYWNCTQPEPGVQRLEGVAVNAWSAQEVRFLEFELTGVDNRERIVSEARGEARNFLLGTFQSTPFQLDLRTAGGEVRFDLYYQYRFQDRSHREMVAAQLSGRPFLLAQQTNRFMARDVCSETQHRVR